MRRLFLLSAIVLVGACANDPMSPTTTHRASASGPSWGIGTSPTRTLPPGTVTPPDTDPRGIGTSPSVTTPVAAP